MSISIRDLESNQYSELRELLKFGESLDYLQHADEPDLQHAKIARHNDKPIAVLIEDPSTPQSASLYPLSDRAQSSAWTELAYELSNYEELWCRPATATIISAFSNAGRQQDRRILQMRLTKADQDEGLTTAAFSGDWTSVVKLNNAAFKDHPDQGNKTEQDFIDIATQSWFDDKNLQLYFHDGQLGGLFWTKQTKPQLSEIFLVALDPSLHGKGLGTKLIYSAISHSNANAEQTYLHVDSNSIPAINAYRKLGFTEAACITSMRIPQLD